VSGVAVLPRGLSMDGRAANGGGMGARGPLCSRTHTVLEHCLSRAFSALIIIDIVPGVRRRGTERAERAAGDGWWGAGGGRGGGLGVGGGGRDVFTSQQVAGYYCRGSNGVKKLRGTSPPAKANLQCVTVACGRI